MSPAYVIHHDSGAWPEAPWAVHSLIRGKGTLRGLFPSIVDAEIFRRGLHLADQRSPVIADGLFVDVKS